MAFNDQKLKSNGRVDKELVTKAATGYAWQHESQGQLELLLGG